MGKLRKHHTEGMMTAQELLRHLAGSCEEEIVATLQDDKGRYIDHEVYNIGFDQDGVIRLWIKPGRYLEDDEDDEEDFGDPVEEWD